MATNASHPRPRLEWPNLFADRQRCGLWVAMDMALIEEKGETRRLSKRNEVLSQKSRTTEEWVTRRGTSWVPQ